MDEFQIFVSAFQQATSLVISYITNILIKIEVDDLPFWLAIIGFPLATFETFTKHIAVGLNELVMKIHINIQFLVSVILGATIFLVVVMLGYFMARYKSVFPAIYWDLPLLISIFQAVLYILLVTAVTTILVSLSKVIGHGNYITGFGFACTAVSIYIEVEGKFGQIGKVICIGSFIICASLWFYGKCYEKPIKHE